ncbi:serine/threonine protein kinase [Labilithrix luteola]|uniref:Serine/threonine protein kinase n=1 Tax=Labilithrix luteola TaxID=1391654 RepID=A0A0K1PUS5_9BACT|nr:serine/threonine protein kinase [Labilithrix luteola]
MAVPGQLISEKYRIDRVIGEGAMGVVFEATHVQLDGRVALKFLRREALERDDIVGRFSQEARAAVKLKSEHVARVHDVGTHDGMPYMVMEFLEGKNLEEVLTVTGPLAISEAAEFVIDACEGISEAHVRGIVHRDIKPANLFRVDEGGWHLIKVLDFGISKAALSGKVSNVDLKATSTLMGSPFYMSPEQLRSTRDVDRRTDIWALGTVLFELLSGRTVFDETLEFTELVAAIFEKKPRSLRGFRPDVPPELEAIISRCLQKDPDARYQTAAELAIALVPFTEARRSRVVAARAASLVRRAGLAPELEVPPTIPPGGQNVDSDSYLRNTSGSFRAAKAPAVDAFGVTSPPDPLAGPVSTSSSPALSKTLLAPGLSQSAPVVVQASTPPPRPAKRGLMIGVAAAIAVLAGVGAFLGTRSSASHDVPPPAAKAAVPSAPMPIASPEPLPVETATAGASAATPQTHASASASASASGHVSNAAQKPAGKPGSRPAVPVKPSSSPGSAPPPSDLDIRRER